MPRRCQMVIMQLAAYALIFYRDILMSSQKCLKSWFVFVCGVYLYDATLASQKKNFVHWGGSIHCTTFPQHSGICWVVNISIPFCAFLYLLDARYLHNILCIWVVLVGCSTLHKICALGYLLGANVLSQSLSLSLSN